MKKNLKFYCKMVFRMRLGRDPGEPAQAEEAGAEPGRLAEHLHEGARAGRPPAPLLLPAHNKYTANGANIKIYEKICKNTKKNL
jgi:hypothetical protein